MRGTAVEWMLEDIKIAKEMEKMPWYNKGMLLSYLEHLKELYDITKILGKRIKEFLEQLEPLGEAYLKELKEKKMDLGVEKDPYIAYDMPCLLPRFFFKMVHMFGYPPIRIPDIHETWFCYLFRYKGHVIGVRDDSGSIMFNHLTLHPAREDAYPDLPPQEGAEEVLKEFAEIMMRIATNVTPLWFGDL